MKPKARTGTITVMIGVDIKSQPNWNNPSPAENNLSSAATEPNFPVMESITEKKLIEACNKRKTIRKAPLTA